MPLTGVLFRENGGRPLEGLRRLKPRCKCFSFPQAPGRSKCRNPVYHFTRDGTTLTCITATTGHRYLPCGSPAYRNRWSDGSNRRAYLWNSAISVTSRTSLRLAISLAIADFSASDNIRAAGREPMRTAALRKVGAPRSYLPFARLLFFTIVSVSTRL